MKNLRRARKSVLDGAPQYPWDFANLQTVCMTASSNVGLLEMPGPWLPAMVEAREWLEGRRGNSAADNWFVDAA